MCSIRLRPQAIAPGCAVCCHAIPVVACGQILVSHLGVLTEFLLIFAWEYSPHGANGIRFIGPLGGGQPLLNLGNAASILKSPKEKVVVENDKQQMRISEDTGGENLLK